MSQTDHLARRVVLLLLLLLLFADYEAASELLQNLWASIWMLLYISDSL